ncbi:uncharacterized protein BXZ73DRAFT_98623 [Epithele typhae]|uniref:uncharacterized protein n=1 Tax=Epithele typhae TaxID=378194 RepID=UPI002007EFCC|nr:uncharacterized protein BXZ73DRAFT_98623 [Epithele typhae]KAH9940796.1 hypothetical protein BXZ73DRAFT_98623 [Epithele typhae]
MERKHIFDMVKVHQFISKLESIPAGPLGESDRQNAFAEQRTLAQSCHRLARKRSARFKEILERLKDTEWASELARLSDREVANLARLPAVGRSTKLTNKEWQDTLNVLGPVFTDHRNRRLCAARFPILERAIVSYYVPEYPRTPEQDYRLHFTHFALTEPVRLSSCGPKTKPRLSPTSSPPWATLSAHGGPSPPAKSARTDVLDLAVVNVFRCSNCAHTVLGTREAILHSHACDKRYKMFPNGSRTPGAKQHDLYVTLVLMHERGRPEHECERWGPMFKPSREVAKFELSFAPFVNPRRVAELVRVMGMDPAKATAEQLRASEARVVCRLCQPIQDTKGKRDLKVYRWEKAIDHFNDWLAKHDEFHWELIPKKHMGAVRKVEEKEDPQGICLSRRIDWGTQEGTDARLVPFS